MSIIGQVVLKDKDSEPNLFGCFPKYLAGFEIWKFYGNDEYPNAPRFFNLDIICTPDEYIDGHWLVWRGEREWTGYIVLKKVIGVTSHQDRVEQKTYECAIKFAQDIAEWSNLPFVDETSRAKEGKLTTIVNSEPSR